jgi:NAD(P)-dependent dehydrogenase (short-subunit alcohol dehydrogenase family)
MNPMFMASTLPRLAMMGTPLQDGTAQEKQMKRLEDKRILVTGAASGIGQATALRLLDEGATVVAADIAADGLGHTQARADEAAIADRLTTMPMDVGNEDSVIDGVRSAVQTLGGLDSLVNAAGILRAAHTHQTSLELWNQIVGVNLTGTFLVVREALPALLANSRSAIVNFSSTSASFAHPYMAAYAASKGGIQSFTHALALEYARDGLRAVCVAPGSIKSGITDATGGYIPQDADWSLFSRLMPILPTTLESSGAGMADPAVVAGVIAMLVSEDGAFITGTEIRIDGGTHA